jgi:hypothetical protein
MRDGTIVDATLIAAPPSTKNQDKQRDPEMHRPKKGEKVCHRSAQRPGSYVVLKEVGPPMKRHDPQACRDAMSGHRCCQPFTLRPLIHGDISPVGFPRETL